MEVIRQPHSPVALPFGNKPQYTSNRGLLGSIAGLDTLEKETFLHLRVFEYRRKSADN